MVVHLPYIDARDASDRVPRSESEFQDSDSEMRNSDSETQSKLRISVPRYATRSPNSGTRSRTPRHPDTGLGLGFRDTHSDSETRRRISETRTPRHPDTALGLRDLALGLRDSEIWHSDSETPRRISETRTPRDASRTPRHRTRHSELGFRDTALGLRETHLGLQDTDSDSETQYTVIRTRIILIINPFPHPFGAGWGGLQQEPSDDVFYK